MYKILVVNYASRTAKAFATEKAARQYASEKIDLWGHGEVSIIEFVNEETLNTWVENDFTDDWVIIR